MKDRSDNTVLTRLNENILRQIASAGGGIYVRATGSGSELSSIIDEINKMSKREFESKVFTQYEDRFQYFVGAAIILLIIELLISERKSKWWHRLNLFGENKNKQ
jgi:Ca-activated chloride channel homolog